MRNKNGYYEASESNNMVECCLLTAGRTHEFPTGKYCNEMGAWTTVKEGRDKEGRKKGTVPPAPTVRGNVQYH